MTKNWAEIQLPDTWKKLQEWKLSLVGQDGATLAKLEWIERSLVKECRNAHYQHLADLAHDEWSEGK